MFKAILPFKGLSNEKFPALCKNCVQIMTK